MTTITRSFGFDMGHCLPDHLGGCYRPHGHRYTLDVTVAGVVQEVGPENGMVMDFGQVKVAVGSVVEQLDHRFAICALDPRASAVLAAFDHAHIILLPVPPTAENLAEHIGLMLTADGLNVEEVTLWETPTCRATWRP